LFDQHHTPGFNDFLFSDRADAFARFGLEANLVWVDVKDPGDAVADGVQVVGQLGTFGVDNTIQVHNAITSLGNVLGSGSKHFSGVATAVGFVGVGEYAADVAEGGGAEDRVGHGVQQDIGVAMADELLVMGHVDAAEAQRAAGSQAVRVFADADAQVGRGGVS